MPADFSREGDDPILCEAFALPFDDGGFSFGASRKEHIDGDGKPELSGRDLNVTIDDFVFGDSAQPQRQSGHTFTHSDSSNRASVNTDERLTQVNSETRFVSGPWS